MSIPDRIEKVIFLRAPLAQAWRAISDAEAFGTWFGVQFDGPFVAGQRITGRMRPTQVDEAVAARQAPYAGMPFDFTCERIDAPTSIRFRWHPFAIDPAVDYSQEPTTLIVFTLTEVEGGTELRVVESGFAKIPLARRAQAFTANEEGWTLQCRLVEKYLTTHGA